MFSMMDPSIAHAATTATGAAGGGRCPGSAAYAVSTVSAPAREQPGGPSNAAMASYPAALANYLQRRSMQLRDFQLQALAQFHRGGDSIVVVATGSGKSLCYQLAPLCVPPGKVCVVVSPLISLMQDQVGEINSSSSGLVLGGTPTSALGSATSAAAPNTCPGAPAPAAPLRACYLGSAQKDKTTFEQVKNTDHYNLVYVSPEWVLCNECRLREIAPKICLFAVDEAHCVSEWGHDFRPEYQKLGGVFRGSHTSSGRGAASTSGVRLTNPLAHVPIMCLSATCPGDVQNTIHAKMQLGKACCLIKGRQNRPNLYYKVVFCETEADAHDRLKELLALGGTTANNRNKIGGYAGGADDISSGRPAVNNHVSSEQQLLRQDASGKPQPQGTTSGNAALLRRFAFASTIIYVNTKLEADELAAFLRHHGASAESYHAGRTVQQREKVYAEFCADKVQVVCCTVAFGMGIHKKDVRRVLHFGAPKSVFHYIQQTGRAGRDGTVAECISLVIKNDEAKSLRRVQNDREKEAHAKMWAFLYSRFCRRGQILAELEDENQPGDEPFCSQLSVAAAAGAGEQRELARHRKGQCVGLDAHGNRVPWAARTRTYCGFCDCCDANPAPAQLVAGPAASDAATRAQQAPTDDVPSSSFSGARRGNGNNAPFSDQLPSGAPSSSSTNAKDFTGDAKLFLRGLIACRGQTGLNLVLSLLLGKQNQQVKKKGLEKSPDFGIGAHRSEAFWKALARSIEEKGLAEQVSRQMSSSNIRYFAWRATEQGKTLVRALSPATTASGFVLELPLPRDLADAIADSELAARGGGRPALAGACGRSGAGGARTTLFLPGASDPDHINRRAAGAGGGLLGLGREMDLQLQDLSHGDAKVKKTNQAFLQAGIGHEISADELPFSRKRNSKFTFREGTQVDELFDQMKQLRLVYGRGKTLPQFIKSGPFLRNMANVRPSTVAKCVNVNGYEEGGVLPSLLEKFVKLCVDFCRRTGLPADNFAANEVDGASGAAGGQVDHGPLNAFSHGAAASDADASCTLGSKQNSGELLTTSTSTSSVTATAMGPGPSIGGFSCLQASFVDVQARTTSAFQQNGTAISGTNLLQTAPVLGDSALTNANTAFCASTSSTSAPGPGNAAEPEKAEHIHMASFRLPSLFAEPPAKKIKLGVRGRT